MKKILSLNLVCYLRCNGFKEHSVGYNPDNRKIYFNYEESESLKEMIDEYKKKDTMVCLHDFIVEFRYLKNEIYKHMKEYSKKKE